MMGVKCWRRLCHEIPSSYIAQNDNSTWVSSGDDDEVDVYVENDGPTHYQVVQRGAAQLDQPDEGSITLINQSDCHYIFVKVPQQKV